MNKTDHFLPITNLKLLTTGERNDISNELAIEIMIEDAFPHFKYHPMPYNLRYLLQYDCWSRIH